MTNKLHASASWPVFNCPASKRESEKASGNTSKPARDGTSIHRLIAKHFNGETILWDRYEDMSDEQKEVKYLFDSAMVIYEDLSEWFGDAKLMVEHEMDKDHEIVGTLDLGCYLGMRISFVNDADTRIKSSLFIIDWKSGRIRDIESAICQLKTYAGLFLDEMRFANATLPDKIYLYVGWLRDREYESDPSHPFTVAEIDEHMAVLRANLKDQDVYVTGDHCEFCKGKPTCPKIGEQAMLPLKWAQGEVELVLNPENALKLKEFLPMLKRAAGDAEEALRNYVEGMEAQGQEVVHDGRRLTIGPGSEAKRHVGMVELENFVGESGQELLTECDPGNLAIVPFSAIKETVMNNAPRGKKGAAVKEIEKLLDDKGLIVKSQRKGSLKIEKEIKT